MSPIPDNLTWSVTLWQTLLKVSYSAKLEFGKYLKYLAPINRSCHVRRWTHVPWPASGFVMPYFSPGTLGYRQFQFQFTEYWVHKRYIEEYIVKLLFADRLLLIS